MRNLKNLLTTKKPILKLIPLEKTAVHTKTKREYTELMRVYTAGGWSWNSEYLPLQLDFWKIHQKQTCIDVGDEDRVEFDKKTTKFGYGIKTIFLEMNWDVISPKEFYNKQKITPKILNEINKYFEEIK